MCMFCVPLISDVAHSEQNDRFSANRTLYFFAHMKFIHFILNHQPYRVWSRSHPMSITGFQYLSTATAHTERTEQRAKKKKPYLFDTKWTHPHTFARRINGVFWFVEFSDRKLNPWNMDGFGYIYIRACSDHDYDYEEKKSASHNYLQLCAIAEWEREQNGTYTFDKRHRLMAFYITSCKFRHRVPLTWLVARNV